MKKKQRLILRTRTYERILIRRKDRSPRLWKNSESFVGESLSGAQYRLEIHKTEAGKTHVVFECEFSGSIEVIENCLSPTSVDDSAFSNFPKKYERR